MGSTGLIADGSLGSFQPPFWKDKTTLENKNLEENETNDSFKSLPTLKTKIDEAEGLKLNSMKNRDAENEQEIKKVESLDDLDEQITLSRLIIDRCLADWTKRTEKSLSAIDELYAITAKKLLALNGSKRDDPEPEEIDEPEGSKLYALRRSFSDGCLAARKTVRKIRLIRDYALMSSCTSFERNAVNENKKDLPPSNGIQGDAPEQPEIDGPEGSKFNLMEEQEILQDTHCITMDPCSEKLVLDELDEQDDSDDGFDTRDFTFDRETMHNEAFEMMKSKTYVDTATNLANEMKQMFPHKFKANKKARASPIAKTF